MKALVAAIVLATGVADANVWKSATDDNTARAEATQDAYEGALRKGDELVIAATSHSAALHQTRDLVKRAEEMYRNAASIKPEQAEPYFRIGTLLLHFFLDCQGPDRPLTCDGNAAATRRAVTAWDEFERRAPLDPRLTEILFHRGIYRTKLVDTTRDPKEAQRLLVGAAQDYEALLSRTDGAARRDDTILGNLAETYMMLGRLDDAITMYERAIRAGGSISTVYGLAVALDRDERGQSALDVIRDQGVQQFQQYRRLVEGHSVFYVPAGEEYYYYALADEAFGATDEAIELWTRYVQSGAHPEYQPRAKDHIEQLQKHRKTPSRSPIPMWPQDLFP